MKLIVELSENDYKALKEDGVQNHLALADTIIACSVPYSVPYEERPQGNFISRDYLKQMIPAPIEDEYKYVHQIIDNAPAVKLGEDGVDLEKYCDRLYEMAYEMGKAYRPQGNKPLNWLDRCDDDHLSDN